MRHRVFAGTQRLLLSGDPAWTRAYSAAFAFCGSAGVDLMEPLTCRGRRGTGQPGQRRTGYADAALEPRWDWQKYLYWYRVWGRLTYDQHAPRDHWQRAIPQELGDGLEVATSVASRILPLVTTAHAPSAACDAYWPEVYWNQPVVEEPTPNPYGDTPTPKTCTHASALDPQLFTTADACAGELLTNRRSGRYTPVVVATWLDDLSSRIEAALRQAPGSVAATRATIDARILAGLGRFFASKFRATVLYALFEKTGASAALDAAIVHYTAARESWARLVADAGDTYQADLSASDRFSERGHWCDRLDGIDQDIARMEARRSDAHASGDAAVRRAIAETEQRAHPREPRCAHTPPPRFDPDLPLELSLGAEGEDGGSAARCYYRPVNQAATYTAADMEQGGDGRWRVTIPASALAPSYPLQYYFVLDEGTARAAIVPGLGPELTSTPYFVVPRG